MLDLFFSGAILVAAFLNLLLGVIVFSRNPKNIINKSFTLLAFSFFAWGTALFFYQHPIIFSSEFWIKFDYILVMVFCSSILMFSFVFPYTVFKKAWIYAGLFVFIFFLVNLWFLYFTRLMVVDVVIDPDKGLQTILGPYYIFYSFWDWLVLLWGVFNLIFKAKLATPIQKLQMRYFWIAFILFGIAVNIPDVVIPLVWKTTEYFPISVIASVFFSGTSAYLILKHRFLDIRVIVARSIAYVLLLSILGFFYASGLFLAGTFFMNQGTNVANLLVSTLLALIMAFTFQPLKRELEKFTDAIFYRGQYDPDKLMSGIGLIMNTNIDLKPLTAQIVKTLIEQMRISKGAFVVLGEGKTSIYEIVDIGFPNKLILTIDTIQQFFSRQTIIFDELEENSLKSSMRQLNISLVKTLYVKGEPVGVLLLGEKSSGEIYSNQDLKVLDILAPEMAVAIQNSLSYDKIKRFNIILSDEVKKQTADLQDANCRLMKLDQLKDDFVSIASHELRTPMAAIRSYAWMALHRSDVPISDKVEKYLVRILMSTERLINLVNDMLNISRIESGRVEINPEPVDLISLCKDIVDEVYYSKSTEKNVKFVLLEQLVPKVFADPEKLRQVVLNILGNALKFSPSGGKITIGFFTDGKVTETYIKDEGPGIIPEDMGRLFKKFGRLDSTYTAAATSGGTGLGLFISKSLIELMHGRIWAVSQGIGKGSTFSFALPVASPEVIKNADQYTVIAKGEAKSLEPAVI